MAPVPGPAGCPGRACSSAPARCCSALLLAPPLQGAAGEAVPALAPDRQGPACCASSGADAGPAALCCITSGVGEPGACSGG